MISKKMFSKKIIKRIQQIDKTNLLGISLMGSYSRNEHGEFSDIDIVCISKKERELEVLFIEEKYMVISFVTENEVEKWFTNPELSFELLYGVAKLIRIWDSNNYLDNLKWRALSFKGDEVPQLKIDKYVNKELTFLIEEVNKGIQGLISKDKGRMLNCIFGLSHLLAKIIYVKKRILIVSDNTKYEQVLSSYKENREIEQLIKKVFGEVPMNLEERVRAGLKLFIEISNEFMGGMDGKTVRMITTANNSIMWALNKK